MLSLKAAFAAVCLKNPGLNKSPYNNQIWSGLRAERTLTLCNHLRRLARDNIRKRQCLGKCSGYEATELQELIGMVSLQDLEEAGVKRRAEDTAGSSTTPKACKTELQEEVPGSSTDREAKGHLEEVAGEKKGRRELKEEVSLVSVDSEGYPSMLKAEDRQQQTHKLSFPDTPTMKAALEQDVGAKVKKRPASSGKVKTEPKERQLRCTLGTNQAYIHFGQQFLVAISKQRAASLGKDHKNLITELKRRLELETTVDKAKALSLREELLKP